MSLFNIGLLRSLLPLLVCLLGAASAAQTTVAPGQLRPVGERSVLVLSVEDSCCPAGTQCIWAGEVKADVLVMGKGRWQLEHLRWTPGQESNASASQLRIRQVTGEGDDLRLTLSDERP